MTDTVAGYEDMLGRVSALSEIIRIHRREKQTRMTPVFIIAQLAGYPEKGEELRTTVYHSRASLERARETTVRNTLMKNVFQQRKKFFDPILTAAEDKINSMNSHELYECISKIESDMRRSISEASAATQNKDAAPTDTTYLDKTQDIVDRHSGKIKNITLVRFALACGNIANPKRLYTQVAEDLKQQGIAI